MKTYDAIIIGAGHNGLVCACYLAKAGLSVRVLERRAVVGGAAVTEEFYPGFRNSTASYTVGLLSSKIIEDLHLHDHGLQIVRRPLNNFFPTKSGEPFHFSANLESTCEAIGKISAHDAQMLPHFYAMLERVAEVFKQFVWDTPPTTKGLRNIFPALKATQRFNKLEVWQQREIINLFTRSAADIVGIWFESDHVKAAFCWDAVVGNYASPYMTGTGYVLLHHVWGESPHGWGHAVGGMGSITQAMAEEARRLGVTIDLSSPVMQVCVANNSVHGVILEGGELIAGDIVVSNAHPQTLYQDLISPSHLPGDFKNAIRQYKNGSGTFRINAALSSLPRFSCKPEAGDHLGSGILILPSLRYMEKAYFDARLNGMSEEPIIEMLVPSYIDSTLAPDGKHVATIFAQHFDPDLEWNDKQTTDATSKIFATINQYAPNFQDSVLGFDALSPRDLERRFGLLKGDIFHGALSLDQLYSCRPVLGHGNYRGPLKGLYMCGAGTHPGGGVTGIPGHNAAREIIKDNC